MDLKRRNTASTTSKMRELPFLVLYAAAFYAFIIRRSLQLSRDHYAKLFGLRPGWLTPQCLNDVSDAQWRLVTLRQQQYFIFEQEYFACWTSDRFPLMFVKKSL